MKSTKTSVDDPESRDSALPTSQAKSATARAASGARLSSPAPPGVDLDALTGELAALRMIAGDAIMAEACALLRNRLRLTPQKVMVILLRRLAPDARVQQGEEAICRGMDTETLKEAKERGEFAREMSGLQVPVKG